MKNHYFISPSLFNEEEITRVLDSVHATREIAVKKHELDELKIKDRCMKCLLNKHLLPEDFETEGFFQLPVLESYCGELPDYFVPYNASVKMNVSRTGVYCHIDDRSFQSTWTHPFRSYEKISRYMVAVAPDHTLWVDGLVCENVEQLRRNRTTALFWQSEGLPTIPSASWGDAESVDWYAFDGLPKKSWISIGHQRNGNESERRLYRYAVRKLIEKKDPIGLIVFGAKLDFEPECEVRYYPSFISKLRTL